MPTWSLRRIHVGLKIVPDGHLIDLSKKTDRQRRPGRFILFNYVQEFVTQKITIWSLQLTFLFKSFFNASDAMKANKLSAPDGVVRTYLTAKSIDGHDADAVRIRVDQGQRRQLEFPVQPHQESTSSHVRIAFALITSATVRNWWKSCMGNLMSLSPSNAMNYF